MFEYYRQPIIPLGHFVQRMFRAVGVLPALLILSLLMLVFHRMLHHLHRDLPEQNS